MKYLKVDSPPAVKLQELENLMNKLNITIGSYGSLFVIIDDVEYTITDKETGGDVLDLPRSVDSELLARE